MMHLTEDQIYHLVQAIGNHEALTAEEEQQIEHIRSCKECMESYCIMAVLAEATSIDCDLVLNPAYREEAAAPARKLLAAIRVTDPESDFSDRRADSEPGGRFSV